MLTSIKLAWQFVGRKIEIFYILGSTLVIATLYILLQKKKKKVSELHMDLVRAKVNGKFRAVLDKISKEEKEFNASYKRFLDLHRASIKLHKAYSRKRQLPKNS